MKSVTTASGIEIPLEGLQFAEETNREIHNAIEFSPAELVLVAKFLNTLENVVRHRPLNDPFRGSLYNDTEKARLDLTTTLWMWKAHPQPKKSKRRKAEIVFFVLTGLVFWIFGSEILQSVPFRLSFMGWSTQSIITIIAFLIAYFLVFIPESNPKKVGTPSFEVAEARKDLQYRLRELGLSAGYVIQNAIEEQRRSTFDSVRRDPQYVTTYRQPAPQPFGISDYGAEELVATWVRFLGDPDAVVTQKSGDGGIDVVSPHLVVQVKNYAVGNLVPVASIRDLAGTAAVEQKRALFFTSSGYTEPGVAFANRANIALFTYSASAGGLTPINELAAQIFRDGLSI